MNDDQKRTLNLLAGLSAVLFITIFVMGLALVRHQNHIGHLQNQIEHQQFQIKYLQDTISDVGGLE